MTYNETDIPIVDAAIPKTINDTDVVSLLRGSFLASSNGMGLPGVIGHGDNSTHRTLKERTNTSLSPTRMEVSMLGRYGLAIR